MSAFEMLDMCVYYIARRHHMLTQEHVAILDEIWDLYEPRQFPPLPPSPPPEREHIYFDGEGDTDEQDTFPQQTEEWPCSRCMNEEIWDCGQCVYRHPSDEQVQAWREENARKEIEQRGYLRMWEEQEKADTLWRQIPQPTLVSASMPHQETCDCDTCDWQDRCRVEEEQQLPSCSSYLRASCDADRCTYECEAPCGSAAPMEEKVIDLTCEEEKCEYGCECEPSSNAYAVPPPYSCLYGCSYDCGAKYDEKCIAQFDAKGNQLPPLVESVVKTAIESDDDMPPLVSIGARPTPKGWFNPEEDTDEETEIVDVAPSPQPQPQQKPPKEKPLFPYNHPRWPSPRAKALVKRMIAIGETSLTSISNILNKPIKTLNHDNCMHFLAKRYRLTPEKLLDTSIYDLHNPPSAPYWGVSRCACSFCRREKRGY